MAANDHPDISNAEFAQFQKLIYKIAGISLADSKKVLLVGRLGRRLKHHGLSSFAEYYRFVASGDDPGELQTMVDLLTTNETYFFREEAHFEFLAKTIVAQHPAGTPFNVWSAASSTGEEIYTISFVLAETLGLDANWTVTGSDISTAGAGHGAARPVLARPHPRPAAILPAQVLPEGRAHPGRRLHDRPRDQAPHQASCR
jgi:chemotaxis protein methyltransferase CheR